MQDLGWVDQMVLVVLWVGLIYSLFGLAMAYLALTDLEWRQLIKERLHANWRVLKLCLILAYLNLLNLMLRGLQWLHGNRMSP